jgi:nitroreductase
MRQDFKQIIYYATKAPSGHNTQPWKFQIEDDAIIIQPDYSRSLPIVDPDNHALFISLGCALENLLIAANYYGYQANGQLYSGQNPFIRVDMQKGERNGESELFSQIEVRQSTRNTYNGEPIPEEHLLQLLQAARQENTRCIILTQMEEIDPVIAL